MIVYISYQINFILPSIDEVYLSSSSEARTFVNGRLLNGRIELKSGSRIIFGAAHVFRFVHPSRIEANHQRTFSDNNDDGLEVPQTGITLMYMYS